MDKAVEMKQMIEKYRQDIGYINNYCIAKNEIFIFSSIDGSYNKDEISADAKMQKIFEAEKYIIKDSSIAKTKQLMKFVEDLNIQISDKKVSSIIVYEFEFMYLHYIDRVIK